jgi:hypothetical protein
MIKTDKNYRMPKPIKRRLALGRFPSKQVRDSWKKAMIDSDITGKNSEFAVFK